MQCMPLIAAHVALEQSQLLVQMPPATRHAITALNLDTLPITAPSAAYLHHKPRGLWLPSGNVGRRVNLGIKGVGLDVPRESKDSGKAADPCPWWPLLESVTNVGLPCIYARS